MDFSEFEENEILKFELSWEIPEKESRIKILKILDDFILEEPFSLEFEVDRDMFVDVYRCLGYCGRKPDPEFWLEYVRAKHEKTWPGTFIAAGRKVYEYYDGEEADSPKTAMGLFLNEYTYWRDGSNIEYDHLYKQYQKAQEEDSYKK